MVTGCKNVVIKKKTNPFGREFFLDDQGLHCKKRLEIFQSPAGMSLTKLWLATSRLGTGKTLTFLYGVQCLETLNVLVKCHLWAWIPRVL